jgi:hypothetical protein
MSHRTAVRLDAECVQCPVCEKILTDGEWFARIKRDGHSLLLCSQPCAARFYGRRLPLLRYIHLLTMLQPLANPAEQRQIQPNASL